MSKITNREIDESTLKTTGAGINTGTDDTKFSTPKSIADWLLLRFNRTLRISTAQRMEENIKQWSITADTTVLRFIFPTAAAYYSAYVEVSAGGVSQGMDSSAAHARFFIRISGTTVTITQIGSTETNGTAITIAGSAAGYVAVININKNVGSTSFDGTIYTNIKILNNSNASIPTISYV